MTLKERILEDFKNNGIDLSRIKIKYFKQSPYQKRRYKPEFVEEECWIQTIPQTSLHGFCVTNESWDNFFSKVEIINIYKEMKLSVS